MTAFICTLTDEAAWLSADTMMAAPVGVDPEIVSATQDMQLAFDSAYVGGGGPVTVNVMGSTCKVWSAPHRQLLMTGAGSWLALARFSEVLNTRSEITGIEAVPDAAQDWLPRLCQDSEMVCVVAGWDREQGKVRGYAFTAAGDDVSQVELQPNTHTMQPAPCPDADGYDAIVQMQDRARHGCEVVAFHQQVIRNVHDAFMTGQLRPGIGVGDAVVSARLTRDGIALQYCPRTSVR